MRNNVSNYFTCDQKFKDAHNNIVCQDEDLKEENDKQNI